MTENDVQQPPEGLGEAGTRLWLATTKDYDLEVHELSLLALAARHVDRLEAIAEALVGAPLTITNFKGDPVANPLLVEQRMLGAALARTLAALRLPTGEEEDGTLVRPQRRGGARQAYGIRAVR